ncbi:MAG: AMIN domain-containing protein [Nitrospinota bacterium]|nr:AMIN domain-containing protein [Nitrospinota bacterium]
MDNAPVMAELLDIKISMNLAEKTIILVTNVPVKYTTFRLEKPTRLVVEMRPAKSRIPSAPITMDDELVDKISVYEFRKADAVRLEITLKSDARHAVVSRDNGVEIKLIPMEEKKDPAKLARRLMEAEAEVARLTSENEELKVLLKLQNEKLRERKKQ